MLFELCEPRRGKFSDNKMVRRGEGREGRRGRGEEGDGDGGGGGGGGCSQ